MIVQYMYVVCYCKWIPKRSNVLLLLDHKIVYILICQRERTKTEITVFLFYTKLQRKEIYFKFGYAPKTFVNTLKEIFANEREPVANLFERSSLNRNTNKRITYRST